MAHRKNKNKRTSILRSNTCVSFNETKRRNANTCELLVAQHTPPRDGPTPIYIFTKIFLTHGLRITVHRGGR